MRTAFIKALCECAERDPHLWLITGDIGYSVLEAFADRFPERFINAGVAEQNMACIAAGLALSGQKVFFYSIANFPVMRCLEQIRNDICYHNLNVKVVAVGGGQAYGPAGYTHHAIEDLAVMRAMPNMTVMAPGDPYETTWATNALAAIRGPGYLRLGKANEPIVHQGTPPLALGKAAVLRAGNDITLIATGGVLAAAIEAADQLQREQIGVRVLSMHTLAPFDAEAVCAAARQTRGIVTVEEHRRTGGLGSAVAEVLVDQHAHTLCQRLCVQDSNLYISGNHQYLREKTGLSPAAIQDALRALYRESRGKLR